MADLIAFFICSIDGFVADEAGGFEWAEPDEEVHAFVNDLERSTGTALYGRRMWEVMRYWDTEGDGPDAHPVERDYAAVWRATDKVVYSRTLAEAPTSRTRLVRSFDAAEVRRLVEHADRDVTISGPTLAAAAFGAGIVDELRLLVVPAIVGGGLRALPAGLTVSATLVEQRGFASGAVFLRYRLRS